MAVSPANTRGCIAVINPLTPAAASPLSITAASPLSVVTASPLSLTATSPLSIAVVSPFSRWLPAAKDAVNGDELVAQGQLNSMVYSRSSRFAGRSSGATNNVPSLADRTNFMPRREIPRLLPGGAPPTTRATFPVVLTPDHIQVMATHISLIVVLTVSAKILW